MSVRIKGMWNIISNKVFIALVSVVSAIVLAVLGVVYEVMVVFVAMYPKYITTPVLFALMGAGLGGFWAWIMVRTNWGVGYD